MVAVIQLRTCVITRHAVAASAVLLAGLSGNTGAIEFDTGNPDIALRWNNTIRFNYARRVEGRDQAITNAPNSDDGDRNFRRGTVSSRLDLLSEFDLVYKRNYGLRVTATAWYDDAYRSLDNDSAATSNHLVNGQQCGVRHPVLAITIAGANFTPQKALPVLVPCVITFIVVAMVYLFWRGRGLAAGKAG